VGFARGEVETAIASGYDGVVSRVRLLVTDRLFFVTVNLRPDIPFLAEGEFPLVIKALAESRRRERFLLAGYVLMPDHWHALIWPSHPLTISRAVQSVKWRAARSLNRHRGTAGVVWQHQFWDRFVRHEKEFGERLEYMHHNPVRRGLAKRPEDWPWSSYGNYSLDKQRVAACPIQMDVVRITGKCTAHQEPTASRKARRCRGYPLA
jgi:putative transposase